VWCGGVLCYVPGVGYLGVGIVYTKMAVPSFELLIDEWCGSGVVECAGCGVVECAVIRLV